ncbi:unnamed protein product, partial [Meganyctiphanes norvegica]
MTLCLYSLEIQTLYNSIVYILLNCQSYSSGDYVQLMNHGKFNIFLLEQAKGIKLNQDVEIDLDYNGDYQILCGLKVALNYIGEFLPLFFSSLMSIGTLINMAYCILISLGTAIQRLVFGELRVSEQQHIKDKFWNFVFYKFIFVFGVMNVQAMDEVVLWCSWFSVLGFLHLLAQLCKDRFEYLSFSPTTPRRTHVRLLGLLGIILTIALFCLLICVLVGCHSGINTFAFMVAECILLIVRTLYVITRYSIYLWDITHEGLWEKRGRYVYMTELVFELSELIIDMVHHIHMLVWGNMFLTMASLVICMQLRLLFYQLQHKVKSHRNYLRVLKLVNMFPEVSGSAIDSEEKNCAICWELVSMGRRLPCSHLFHGSCLHAWLHQDLTCPTCRHKLQQPQLTGDSNSLLDGLLSNESSSPDEEHRGVSPSPGAPEGSPGSVGWRYVSWLPSFSVEQSHTQLPRHHQQNTQPATTSQLDNLARKVLKLFLRITYIHIIVNFRHRRRHGITFRFIADKLFGPAAVWNLTAGFAIVFSATMDKEHNFSILKADEEIGDEPKYQSYPLGRPYMTCHAFENNA